jgi:voltage-dependent potassium channel beta subunit
MAVEALDPKGGPAPTNCPSRSTFRSKPNPPSEGYMVGKDASGAAQSTPQPVMNYRRLGRSGLQVSELSFGSWVTYVNQVDSRAARELMAAAFDAGVNFFDNAEVYANGRSEELMGAVLKTLRWPRMKYVVSTKFYWGMGEGPNEKNTLNRKYLLHAIDGSLTRLQLDHVDIVFCHRADPETPIDETVWAMHDIIGRGKALYWGTSEWPAEAIRAAWDIAERHHLHKPVTEQAQYNVFHRRRVESEYASLYQDLGLGLTTWSPLASGLLTGKYRQGVPAGSRATLASCAFLRDDLTDPVRNRIVDEIESITRDLGCGLAPLAIAWCLKNRNVSSTILGATRPAQLAENLKALEVLPKLTTEAMQRIDAIVGSGYD